MATLARTSWVGLLLTALPRPMLKALDDWSYRVARRRAERRRVAVNKRQAGK